MQSALGVADLRPLCFDHVLNTTALMRLRQEITRYASHQFFPTSFLQNDCRRIPRVAPFEYSAKIA
jgi:hypothetical protein